jgi:uncharacterized protein YndB with AHSA1/START domain
VTSVAKRTDSAYRIIVASPARLYAAFIDPMALAAWLPPKGMTGRIEAFDPRPGGAYRMALAYDDKGSGRGKSEADTDRIEGEFVGLEPDMRIVQRAAFESDDPSLEGVMTITWRFDPVPQGTRVTVTCADVPVGIRKKDHLAGLRSTLANLAAFAE